MDLHNTILLLTGRLDADSWKPWLVGYLNKMMHADRKSSHFVPTWQDIHVMESLSKVLSRVAERNY